MASAAADLSSMDGNSESRDKRPVWNILSNGSIEVGAVMDAISWPPLSESTKACPKSSSSDSLKSLCDASASASPPPPPGPLVAAKPTVSASIPNPNPVQNPMPPARQKSMKRGSGSGNSTSANGGAVLPALQPSVSGETLPEPSPRGFKSGGGFATQPHGGPDQHRGGYGGGGGNRRGNNGGHSRFDQDFNHRGAQMHQQRGGGVRSYPRPPQAVSAPFNGPPMPVRPFVGNPMTFPDLPSSMYLVAQPAESLRGMPFVPHHVPHAMFFPAMDPQRALLLKQIDYYFSSENLCKDVFLRQKMDDQGWVPISLIAGFNRVKQLTNNIQYILDTVRLSTLVEVQGERIRRRNDWMHWLLIPPNNFGSASGPLSLTTTDYDSVAAHLQNVSLEGTTTNHNRMRGPIYADVVLTRSASGNLNNQFQVGESGRDGNEQFTGYTDLDRFHSTRSLARSDTL